MRSDCARLLGATAALALAALPACSETSTERASSPSGVLEVEAATKLPAATLTDWVSYADVVVAVTVTDEAEIPPVDPATEARGEGLLVRSLTVQVDEVVWSHPSAASPGEQFTFTALGWILRDGARTPVVADGAVRLEIDRRYLLPITFWPNSGEWAPIAPSSVTPLDAGETVGVPDDATAAQDALAGQDLATSATTLGAVRPDPIAESRRDLPAVDRYELTEATTSAADD